MRFFYGLFFLLLCAVNSKAVKKASSDSFKPGYAEMNISFENGEGTILYTGQAIDLYGVDHYAQSEADLKKQEDALNKFQKDIVKFVQFDKKNKCKFGSAQTDHATLNWHTSYTGNFSFSCEKSLMDTTIKLDPRIFSPSLKKLSLTVGIERSFLKDFELKQFPAEIDVKVKTK